MKVIGTRKGPERVAPTEAQAWLDSVAEMLEAGLDVPRGVYRFRSHEEADLWMREQVIRAARALRRSRTSDASPEA